MEKDAKDWMLDEQAAAATDIGAKGEASPVYAKVKAAMDAGTTWLVKLTNDETMTYRIIGINHDDLADGSGKAGLTFLTTSTTISSRMNTTNTNDGGWEASELRQKMNSGEIWNLIPSELQSKVKAVKKLTNNVGGGDANRNAAVTVTTDKLFLLSYSEIVPTSFWASDQPWMSSQPWTSNEGTQYEAFGGKVTNNYGGNDCLQFGHYWWERSVSPVYTTNFLIVGSDGCPAYGSNATHAYCTCPAFCF